MCLKTEYKDNLNISQKTLLTLYISFESLFSNDYKTYVMKSFFSKRTSFMEDKR